MRADGADPTGPQPLAGITSGMRVIDAAGEEVGTVAGVTRGDPNAVTVQEPSGGPGVLAGQAPHPSRGDEPDLPADLAARLLRTGYLKVAGHGLLTTHYYVSADQIARVCDVVQLRATRAQLAARD
jgi:hypothetical protein